MIFIDYQDTDPEYINYFHEMLLSFWKLGSLNCRVMVDGLSVFLTHNYSCNPLCIFERS